MQINAPILPGFDTILTPAALAFVAKLHRALRAARQATAGRARRTRQAARRRRAARLPARDAGTSATATGRSRRCPPALQCRRVEITGPVEAKMVINAFNSGADSYMTDFEDSNSPKWTQPDPGPDQPRTSAIRRTLTLGSRAARPTSSTTRSPRCRCARAAGTSTRSTCWSTASASRRHLRLRAVLVPQREGAARARRRPVLLPAQDGEPPRGAAVERRSS